MADFAESTSTALERRLGPLKVVSLVEAAMWVVAALFLLTHNRVGELLLWSIHGTIALAFAGMVLLIFRPLGWSVAFTAFAILTGPIGAVAVFERLRREEPAIHAREQARLGRTMEDR